LQVSERFVKLVALFVRQPGRLQQAAELQAFLDGWRQCRKHNVGANALLQPVLTVPQGLQLILAVHRKLSENACLGAALVLVRQGIPTKELPQEQLAYRQVMDNQMGPTQVVQGCQYVLVGGQNVGLRLLGHGTLRKVFVEMGLMRRRNSAESTGPPKDLAPPKWGMPTSACRRIASGGCIAPQQTLPQPMGAWTQQQESDKVDLPGGLGLLS